MSRGCQGEGGRIFGMFIFLRIRMVYIYLYDFINISEKIGLFLEQKE